MHFCKTTFFFFLFPLDVYVFSSLAADAPKDVVATINPTPVKEGQSATLICSANGNPAPSFKWFKNNIALPDQQQAQWTITPVNTGHNGRYNCEAHNSRRSVKSQPLDVDVTCGYFSCLHRFRFNSFESLVYVK